MATAASDNPQAGAGRPLPKREADIFKNVVKYYEMKQYKKAIKQADTILKKFPKHGETLAMKGLTLSYMSKREEAHALVKEGLMNDMRSHVCWHVYGLLHRSDHDYKEAIKAYKNALRMDPKNLQILRDLSMLQIHLRDVEGFAMTRNTLLTLKPNAKINWLAFALARHLTGDLQGAIRVIDIYLGTLSEGSAELGRCYESSELALYRNSILAEMPNNLLAALDHLDGCEAITVDRGAWLLKKAEYHLKLMQYAPARQTVYHLLDRGMTENHTIHSILMCTLLEVDENVSEEALHLPGTQTLATMMPLTEAQKLTILDVYRNELAEKYPRSSAIQRIPITLLEGEELRKAMDERCRKDLQKGVPSLCAELRSFLWTKTSSGRYIRTTDPVDVKAHQRFAMFVDMVEGYVTSLTKWSRFAKDDKDTQEPSTLFWAWFLRAGLHELAAEYAEGIAVVDKCIAHTPEEVDAYELKARLLKSSGSISDAAKCLEAGREMDKQDRYINNQTTKYMLQAGNEEDALARISMFTRHEGNPEQNLYDMQCSWYELELADCLARKGEWGRSLKKYGAVAKHFEDFQEDQFDFHSYCLRKVTLRAYVSVLRYEDVIHGHDFFCRAAEGMIRIYLYLHDHPILDFDEPDYSKMSAAERKKAKAIARKKKKVTEKQLDEKKTNDSTSENGKGQKSGKNAVDEDALGLEFLKKDPMEEAKKYSSMLSKYAPKQFQSWVLQYDVAMRRKKPLLALQALHKMKKLDPECSELFLRTVDFAGKTNDFDDSPGVSLIVLTDEFPVLLGNQSVADYIDQAIATIRNEPLTALPMRTATVKAIVDTKHGPVKEAIPLIINGGIDARKATVENCLEALTVLKSLGAEAADATQQWTEYVVKRFPSALPNQ